MKLKEKYQSMKGKDQNDIIKEAFAIAGVAAPGAPEEEAK